MEKLIIRKPQPDDFGRVRQIHAAIQQQQAQLSLNGREEDCFVAEIDGKVVGFVIGYSLRGSFGLEKSAWIATVGIDPKYMGQKIGKQLAEKVLAYYKGQGYDSVHIAVRWDAIDLLSFFKTIGFSQSKFINLEKSLIDD
ncbi:MAG: GNAT family N-acetyltransferase [Pseudomonadota bacterium]